MSSVGSDLPPACPTPGAVLRVPLWAGVSMDYTKFCPMLGTGISHQPPSQFFFTFQPKLRSLNSGVGKGRLKITDQYNQHSQRIPQLRPPQLAVSLVPGQEMLPQASGAARGRLHQPVERADKLSRGAAAGSTQPSGCSLCQGESRPALARSVCCTGFPAVPASAGGCCRSEQTPPLLPLLPCSFCRWDCAGASSAAGCFWEAFAVLAEKLSTCHVPTKATCQPELDGVQSTKVGRGCWTSRHCGLGGLSCPRLGL